VRVEDTAARIGGDEFIAILGTLGDGQVAAQIAERAIAAISAPIHYKGNPISVGASIGIGLFPDHADDAAALRRAADVAMYSVKVSGKNRFAFAEREQEAAVLEENPVTHGLNPEQTAAGAASYRAVPDPVV
jgi:diguanylate cyclase (GGDEF)-like protein